MKTPYFRVFLFVFFAAVSTFAAAPGSLDPTFGIGGMVARDFANAPIIQSTALQPDGKILIVGLMQNGPTRDFFVVRLNPNGDYDTTFGTGGIVFTDINGRFDDPNAVAVQNDGKIVVAGGSSTGGWGDMAFVRYMPNGSLDTTFDGDGILLLNSFPGFVGDSITTLSIQPDGKILGGGSVDTDFLIVRINLDGTLDSSFGTGGIVVTSSNAFAHRIGEMAILPDGKILAAGFGSRCSVARYNPNGTLDAGYGSAGFFTMNAGFYAECRAIAIQNDGKAVIAGYGVDSVHHSLLARLNTNGTLDNSFGGTGMIFSNISQTSADYYTDVVIQPDGKILASGISGANNEFDFSVARVNTTGVADPSFGVNGISLTVKPGNQSAVRSVMYGDKLLVMGDAGALENTPFGIRAARYNLATTPTASSDFDGDGIPDYAVFRPSTSNWYVLRSSDNGVQVSQFGAVGDVPVDGDFDGDGRTDLAIFRPSVGQWWVNRSTSGAAFAVQFGQNTDKPAVGDYDKDGRTDIAFWRPSSGTWTVLRSSDGFTSYFGVPFGASGDIPIQAAPQQDKDR